VNYETNSVSSFQALLDTVEELKAEIARLRTVNGEAPGTRSEVQRQATRGPTQADNPDFGQMVKSVYRYAQVSHHGRNWASTPKGVSLAIDKMVANIKPPMPTSELKNELAAFGISFAQQVTKAVQAHLDKCRVSVEQVLLKVNNSDSDRAIEVAEKQLRAKMGKKLKETDKKAWLTEAKNMLATQRESESNNPSSQPARNEEAMSVGCITKPESNKGKPKAKGIPLYKFSDLRGGTPHKRFRAEVSDEEIVALSSGDEEPTLPQVAATQGTGTKPKVTVHNSKQPHGPQVNIRENCKCLILGDSNLRKLSDLPEAFQVECYPGARFSTLNDVVKRLKLPENVTHILIAAGINDKDSKNLSTQVLPQLDALVTTLKGTEKSLSFLEIAIPARASPRQRESLRTLNLYVQDIIGKETMMLIPHEIPEDQVGTCDDGHHYDQSTVQKLAKCISNLFLS
jgi:hypothetical protein